MENKVIVITGGSSGIGRATAIGFAKAGCRVAIGARREAEGEETVRQVEAAGGEAIFVRTDVRFADQVKALVDAAVRRWGRLDYAFNNAGIEGPNWIPTQDYPEPSWDEVIGINLKGVFLAMKYEIPAMLASGGGSIVNMSSIAGLIGGPIGVAYHASKHGVIGATKATAMEYAEKGIRVNAVCPAVIETPMADRAFVQVGMDTAPMHPMARNGTVDEVAGAVVWLCSDQASFITGISLPIDGGWTAK